MTKKIIIVCYANYCRSPVAEKILQNKFDSIIFESYGLQPLVDPNMDPRSRKFLDKKGVNYENHVPRKINAQIIENSDMVLCMDHFILMSLNKFFPKSASKFKIFSHVSINTIIEDPYHFDEKKYDELMEKIFFVCDIYKEDDFKIFG